MKKIYLLLTLCCALIACKKNDVSFTYSPTEPRAGEKVQFTNNSTSGEEWEWTFGDGASSTLKSPTHTYKRPGTYRVLLKVDKRNAWTATKEITVFDTIPTFTCPDTVFTIFKDYTFTANVYNPYNYPVSYLWSVDSVTDPTLTLYFDDAEEELIWLRVILNGDTTMVIKTIDVQDRPTNSVLFRTDLGDFRQRIFGPLAEEAMLDESATPLLDAEQDTMQIYNGKAFYLSDLQLLFPFLEGFHISNRKIYLRGDGLWVANIDGAYPVQIDSLDCYAMTLDTKDNRIYWANENGVWYMPFIGSDNNQFVTVPTLLNTMTDISKIAADGEPK